MSDLLVPAIHPSRVGLTVFDGQGGHRITDDLGSDTLLASGSVALDSEYEIGVPGQPLFLQFQPDYLIRGFPAATFSWVAVDGSGTGGVVSEVAINIQCDPGYFYRDSDPGVCSPCPAGSFNLPGEMDQVSECSLAHTAETWLMSTSFNPRTSARSRHIASADFKHVSRCCLR